MSSPNDKEDHVFEFVSVMAVLALIGCGVWFAVKYIRHERQEGSTAHQLRRIEEEAQKGGWVKDRSVTWNLPENVGTNATRAGQFPAGTNKTTSER